MISIAAFFGAAAFTLIGDAGNFGNSFMPVVGDLISLVISLGLLLAIPVLFLLKKDNWAKFAFACYFPYWIISSVFSHLGSTNNIVKGVGGIWIAASVFDFLIALAIIGAAVLMLIGHIKKDTKFTSISVTILICSLTLYLLSWVLFIAAYAQAKVFWTSYIYLFKNYLFLPVAIFFAALQILDVDIATPVINEKPTEEKIEKQPKVEEQEIAAEKQESASEEAPSEEAAETAENA